MTLKYSIIAMKDLFGLTGMNVIPLGERHSQSFTKRATAKPCRIQIFHGLCAWILRTEARDLGLPADFVIDDEPKIKDLFASIRLLFNPADTGALRRMLLRPAAASVQSPCRNSAPRVSHAAAPGKSGRAGAPSPAHLSPAARVANETALEISRIH